MGGFKQTLLRHRINSCKSTFSTDDEIINYLRSTYPDDYSGTKHKHQTLLLISVRKARKRRKIQHQSHVDDDVRMQNITSSDYSEIHGYTDGAVSEKETVSNNNSSVGVGGGGVKKGPMFKDLVGNEMKKIIKKLKRT
ncbi:cell division control-like protein, partial [Trifolium medium]|nr:cell division control-like protein [Trifolium medium]